MEVEMKKLFFTWFFLLSTTSLIGMLEVPFETPWKMSTANTELESPHRLYFYNDGDAYARVETKFFEGFTFFDYLTYEREEKLGARGRVRYFDSGAQIRVTDGNQVLMGYVRERLTDLFLWPSYDLFDSEDRHIAHLESDRSGTLYTMTDPEGKVLGELRRTFFRFAPAYSNNWQFTPSQDIDFDSRLMVMTVALMDTTHPASHHLARLLIRKTYDTGRNIAFDEFQKGIAGLLVKLKERADLLIEKLSDYRARLYDGEKDRANVDLQPLFAQAGSEDQFGSGMEGIDPTELTLAEYLTVAELRQAAMFVQVMEWGQEVLWNEELSDIQRNATYQYLKDLADFDYPFSQER